MLEYGSIDESADEGVLKPRFDLAMERRGGAAAASTVPDADSAFPSLKAFPSLDWPDFKPLVDALIAAVGEAVATAAEWGIDSAFRALGELNIELNFELNFDAAVASVDAAGKLRAEVDIGSALSTVE